MKKLLLLFVCTFPLFAFAQNTGQLRVAVILYEHSPSIDLKMATVITDAKIIAVDSLTADTLTAYADENGGHIFQDVPAGVYYVKAEKEGYQVSNYYRVMTDEGMFYMIFLVPTVPPLRKR